MAAGVRGFLFDMDGVLYRGARPLPGSRTLLAALARRGVPFALVTNNSTRTPRQYVRHLARMGMRVPEDRIVTSAALTAAYLRARLRPGARVLLIGEPAFRRTLERAGFRVGWERPAAVVVGLDRRLTYRKLAAAATALLDGAAFVAANPDPLLPTARGVIPGTGAAVAALQYATGRRPLVMGKPGPRLLREGMRRIGTRPKETVMVGDQIATDIVAARAAGVRAILVESGLAAARGGPRRPAPDLVVRDLRALWRWARPRL
ncbi:MAG: HAD-IIA family hydrolase [Armatimonadota bacterium]|nr:HAD-IIA family hydrolase [Armatimonadota bacterium]